MERQQIFLYTDWKFHEGDSPMGYYKGLDDTSWESVTVPHDFSVTKPFDKENSSGTGYLPGGTLFYRNRFTLPENHGKVYITFEGVYNNSQVWINSNYLGKRPYGYSTFTYDITEFAAEENVVSVRIKREETADSRWYTGCGITRRVYITLCDSVSVLPDTLFITTPYVSKECAEVCVSLETTMPCEVVHTVIDEDTIVAEGKNQIAIPSPKLWSPDSPHLYTLKTSLICDGEVRDCVYTKFGIRYFSFDADKGFFLNGEAMKLKGVCVHHDGGALGAAVHPNVWRERLIALKECGTNALRTSHNPPDPELLDLCDELGFLTMDEAFDEWEGPKNKWWQGHNVYPPKRFGYYEDFPEWGEKDIKAMVLRDRNHPSIIMWSIGNEIDYPNDPYCHPSFAEMTGNNDNNKPESERMYDTNKPNAERLAVIAKKLVGYVKECDTSRPVTAALAFPELSTKTGYFQALDICGYNYKEHLYDEHHVLFPQSVIYGSENSHSYQAWCAVRDNDYICGQFLWTGIDYMGEAHGWPIRSSMPGLLDMAGFKKQSWHMRKTLWCAEDYAYICTQISSEETEHRRRWRFFEHWNYKEGDKVRVMCFTNSPSAELFINGVSQGVKAADSPEHGNTIMWDVDYTAGEVKVISGSAEYAIKTISEPTQLIIEGNTTLTADGFDTIRLNVYAADDDKNRAAFYNENITVQVFGESAKLVGIENGSGHDVTPYSSNTRHLSNGQCAVYIKSTAKKGDAVVKITSESLSAEFKISVK